ncbi:hypothetical protein BB560_007340 [Smittium megazygosporum]|uniref:Phosphoadenosine phosphosulphate reductase domain-containing protein n=1 Tax=Smittium megazygosporum TaxID=133381 RepID=A0A2T9XWQ7_9FUNG|nr:hypothetical protein BB560_007340 [Smittium megazygosporum]
MDRKTLVDEHGNVDISDHELELINSKLEKMSSEDIIQWASEKFPRLYQETAFGPSGNIIMDMVYGKGLDVPVIFIDTLYHFDETLELSKEITTKYGAKLHTLKPNGVSTREEFEAKHGKLWETSPLEYDFLVKAEPAQRAYSELKPNCVITGRRRTQKGERSNIKILEIINVDLNSNLDTPSDAVDAAISSSSKIAKLAKLNPLASGDWTFQKVRSYQMAYNVPYNKLLDAGYKSIGDIHSTSPVGENEDERSGRWKGSDKTECGLHNDYFAMKAAFNARKNQKNAV